MEFYTNMYNLISRPVAQDNFDLYLNLFLAYCIKHAEIAKTNTIFSYKVKGTLLEHLNAKYRKALYFLWVQYLQFPNLDFFKRS